MQCYAPTGISDIVEKDETLKDAVVIVMGDLNATVVPDNNLLRHVVVRHAVTTM